MHACMHVCVCIHLSIYLPEKLGEAQVGGAPKCTQNGRAVAHYEIPSASPVGAPIRGGGRPIFSRTPSGGTPVERAEAGMWSRTQKLAWMIARGYRA